MIRNENTKCLYIGLSHLKSTKPSVEEFGISTKIIPDPDNFQKICVPDPHKIYKTRGSWNDIEKSYILWNPTGMALDIEIFHSISTGISH